MIRKASETTDTIETLFDGQICVSTGKGKSLLDGQPLVGVGFQALENFAGQIGDSVIACKTSGPKVRMLFKRPESIDVVIRQLLKAQEMLREHIEQPTKKTPVPTTKKRVRKRKVKIKKRVH